jgi:hypothetical protein
MIRVEESWQAGRQELQAPVAIRNITDKSAATILSKKATVENVLQFGTKTRLARFVNKQEENQFPNP